MCVGECVEDGCPVVFTAGESFIERRGLMKLVVRHGQLFYLPVTSTCETIAPALAPVPFLGNRHKLDRMRSRFRGQPVMPTRKPSRS